MHVPFAGMSAWMKLYSPSQGRRGATALRALTMMLLVGRGVAQNAAPIPAEGSPGRKLVATANYGKLPLNFEANQGQTDAQVRFFSRGSGYSLFLTDGAAVLSLLKVNTAEKLRPFGHLKRPVSFTTETIRMELVGARAGMPVDGVDQLEGKANYFHGNDPAKWHTGAPTFAKVRYTGVYPGVDLLYYGNQRQLEYDFVVAPHADAAAIRLHFSGAERLTIARNGDLRIAAGDGEIAFRKPVVYQERDGRRREVRGRFTLSANNAVGFAVGAYDHTRALVIDPTLAYSTYLGGGTGVTEGTGIAVDAAGEAYITGATTSTDFPVTTGSVQQATISTTYEAFVTKLNAAGTALVYSTYLGGTNADEANSIAVDTSGNVFVAGRTSSVDFPITPGAFQTTNKMTAGGTNGFITKLNAAGSTLIYSTYLGGSGTFGEYGGEGCSHIALDGLGNAFLTGITASKDFPVTPGAFQATYKSTATYGDNGFVTKLNAAGTALLYSTYVGGSDADIPNSMAIDAAGNVFIAGETSSTDFPVTGGAYQPANHAPAGYGTGFVTRLNATGTALVYSTFLGGDSGTQNSSSSSDAIGGLAIDSSGAVYVAGYTYSSTFPVTPGAFQSTNKSATPSEYPTLFASKLNPSGSALIYSTYLGSSGGDYGSALALDPSGAVYLTGGTLGTDFPVTADAFQRVNNAAGHSIIVNNTPSPPAPNAYLTELNANGTGLVYSTYLGGSASPEVFYGAVLGYQGDGADAIALDGAGNVYVTGLAGSSDFPVTTGAFQSREAVPVAFVAKFDAGASGGSGSVTTLLSNVNPQNAGSSVTFTAYVVGTGGSGVPTGSVTFLIDGAPAGRSTVDSSGHASFSIGSLNRGAHAVSASYTGDHTASSSGTLVEKIAGSPAKVTAIGGDNQVVFYGAAISVAFGLQVTDSNGIAVPNVTVSFAGPVTFIPFPSNQGSFPSLYTATTGLDGTIYASALAIAPIGVVTVSATVSGLPPVFFTINVLKTQSTVALTISPAPTVAARTVVTLTARVTSATSYASILYFEVAFIDSSSGVQYIGFAGVNSAGVSTYKVVLGAGPHTLQAIFFGSPFILGSTSPEQTLVVAPAANYASAGTLSGSSSSAVSGRLSGAEALTTTYGFTDQLKFFGQAAPTGTVQFRDTTTNTLLGSAKPTSFVQSFTGPVSYPSGAATTGALVSATGDFNKDGYPDIAVTNLIEGTVGILLGRGDGTFKPQVSYPSGAAPYGLAVGDFNGDGYLDLAVTSISRNTVSVLLGKGDGSFAAPAAFATGAEPYGIAVGDFNSDGVQDIAVTNLKGGTVSLLLGVGDGTFAAQKVAKVGTNPFALVAADLNGDGKLDLAVVNGSDNTVSELLGNGDGTFQAQALLATGAVPYSITAGDFNGDGKADLAVANLGANTVSVFLNTGGGTYSPQTTYGTGSEPIYVAAIDFDGSGRQSLAVANTTGNSVSVLVGKGDGSFQPQVAFPSTSGSAPPYQFSVADFNGDGKQDLAVTTFGGSIVGVQLGLQTAVSSISGVTLTGSGQHSITATYVSGPSDPYATSKANSLPVVAAGRSMLTLTSSANPAVAGNSITFTAIIEGMRSKRREGERKVDFFDTAPGGAGYLGSASLGRSTEAKYTTARLRKGKHTITAVVSGVGERLSVTAAIAETVR